VIAFRPKERIIRAAMLTGDDKQWMQAQLENNREWTLAQFERLETKLLTEFHK
jgi:hypothetical protein